MCTRARTRGQIHDNHRDGFILPAENFKRRSIVTSTFPLKIYVLRIKIVARAIIIGIYGGKRSVDYARVIGYRAYTYYTCIVYTYADFGSLTFGTRFFVARGFSCSLARSPPLLFTFTLALPPVSPSTVRRVAPNPPRRSRECKVQLTPPVSRRRSFPSSLRLK